MEIHVYQLFVFGKTFYHIMRRHDTFKLLRGKNVQTRAFDPARLKFRIEGEIKNFSDNQKLIEFINSKRTLHGTL